MSKSQKKEAALCGFSSASTAHHPRSIAAFAERWGLSRATVYNMIGRGELETTKMGRRTIITEDQESACLERGRRSA